MFILMMEKLWLFQDVNSTCSSWQRFFSLFMVDLFCIFHDVKTIWVSSLKLFHFFMVEFCWFLSITLCCTTWFSALLNLNKVFKMHTNIRKKKVFFWRHHHIYFFFFFHKMANPRSSVSSPPCNSFSPFQRHIYNKMLHNRREYVESEIPYL